MYVPPWGFVPSKAVRERRQQIHDNAFQVKIGVRDACKSGGAVRQEHFIFGDGPEHAIATQQRNLDACSLVIDADGGGSFEQFVGFPPRTITVRFGFLCVNGITFPYPDTARDHQYMQGFGQFDPQGNGALAPPTST